MIANVLKLSTILLAVASASVQKTEKALLRGSTVAAPDALLCQIHLVLVDSLDTQRPSEIYECTPVDETCQSRDAYGIDLPEHITQQNRLELEHASLYLSIPGARIDEEEQIVLLPKDAQYNIAEPPTSCQSRKLSQRSLGPKTVLVLRVTTNDSTPDYDADELYNFIFSEDRDISLKRQFDACSMGHMTIQETAQRVMDVRIDRDASGSRSGSLVNAASVVAASMLGVGHVNQYADHVMFCLPPGTGGWAATAGVNSWKSTYNNRWCAYPSGYMHEIGHNIGLGHANSGGTEYADWSGYMSSGTSNTERPFKCYNGGNNWHLGWYEDHAVEVDPSQGPQLLSLAAFVDYPKVQDDQYVLVKVGNLYLQYNRAKGINRESGKAENQLTITEKDDGASTEFVSGLDMDTPIFQQSNFIGSGSELTIEVCSVVSFGGDSPNAEYMTISVGYGDSLCGLLGAQASGASVPNPPNPSPGNPSPPEPSPPEPSPPEPSPPNPSPPAAAATTGGSTSGPCDDSPTEKFFVNIDLGEKTCIWLAARSDWQNILCVEGHAANELCPETCGVCTDTCEDDPSVRFVDSRGGMRNCAWLSIRPNKWAEFCVEGSAVYNGCRETCENCPSVVNQPDQRPENPSPPKPSPPEPSPPEPSPPEPSPPEPSPPNPSPPAAAATSGGSMSEACDDSPTEKFFVNGDLGEQTCIWLAARSDWQDMLCVEGHAANVLCPETCRVCTDTCEDDPSVRFVDNRGRTRNCAWLSIRPNKWAEFCVEGSAVYNGCRETCENCV